MSKDTTENSKRVIAVASVGDKTFQIVESLPVGFYLFVFQGGRCTHDYLQNDAEMAKRCAHQEFGVPIDGWSQLS